MTGTRRAAGALVVLALGGLLAACSSSPDLPKQRAATTTTHHAHAATTTSTSSPTTPAGSSTTAAADLSDCTTLSGVAGQAQGAAGTIVGTISLTNNSATTCTMEGYPGLIRRTSTGSTVAVTVVDGLTIDPGGPATQPPALVTMTPGAQATFTYQYSDVSSSATPCASSSSIAVTTPGNGVPTPAISLTMAPCNNGTVDVSPLYAATS
jgi:hypothetical protein